MPRIVNQEEWREKCGLTSPWARGMIPGMPGQEGERNVKKLSWFVVAVVVALSPCAARSQAPVHVDLSSGQARENSAELLRARSRQDREYAYRLARQKGWGIRSDAEGCSYQLIAIRNGRPLYLAPCNVNAAISTAANLIRGASPYDLTGAGFNVGIWDAGSVLATHQEFAGRVTVKDGSAPGWHACHPAGTIMAGGVNTNAKGMAPAAKILSYDYADAQPQMVLVAASGPLQTSKIYLSNHSYDGLAGWVADTNVSGHQGVHWIGGLLSDRESVDFGQYVYDCNKWDDLCYNAKYYLPVKSAGNNRADNAPAAGTVFYYYTDDWTSKTYDPATDPYSDNHKGGFDTLTYTSCAKNALTVGAVNPAVSGGVRSIAAATMTTFTGWGPTDDGRVKPDIVADGVNVFSASNENNTAYTTLTGTSCAAANATGSAALLVEYYQKLFPSSAMLASTLKALIIHTADDLGNAGPDYSYGWGLMNVKAAADLLKSHKDRPLERHVIEDQLSTTDPSDTWTVWVNSGSSFRVTLCWTDPAGPLQSDLNSPTPVLINDLDLRITGSGGPCLPFVLNPASPASVATTADNVVDNVEQVYIASAPAAGYYTVTVSRKGTLSSGAQKYSLILTGQTVVADVAVTGGPLLFGDKTINTGATPAQSIAVRNNGTGDLTFTGAGIAITGANANQFTFSPAPSTAALAPGASRTVSVVFAPTSAGAKSASVTVTTNDPDQSTVDTVLSGNGVTEVLPEVNFGVSSQSLNENAGAVPISVDLSIAAGPGGVTVDYQVNAESTATGGGVDYSVSPLPGTITFAQGEATKTINLTVVNDPLNEDNETVILQLTNPSGATVGSKPTHTVTITDNDAPPTIQFSFSTLQIGEGDSPAQLTVQLSGNATEKTVTADIATADGTAKAGADYTAISRQITLTPPETSVEVDVAIVDDSQPETPELFTVHLSDPENAVLGLAAVSVEIQDDDIWFTAAPNWMLY